MKTAVLYTRVGTTIIGGENKSIATQLEKLENYCKRNRIKILDSFTDCASARDFNRVGIADLLEFIKTCSNKIDFILFVSWDRFSRNITQAALLCNWLKLRGIEAKAIWEYEPSHLQNMLVNKNLNK